jgi:hypothetical protein
MLSPMRDEPGRNQVYEHELRHVQVYQTHLASINRVALPDQAGGQTAGSGKRFADRSKRRWGNLINSPSPAKAGMANRI